MTNDPTVNGTTAEEFLRNLNDSGLSVVDEAQIAANAIDTPTGSKVAARLVAVGALTEFQANAVLMRRFADLRMGNYDVLDKLGVGGMGAVFKARHRRMKRVVALKVLTMSAAQSATFAQRFQREVETIAKLQHPNIVMAFDADEAELGPFLIMEFVDGSDLANDVEKRGPLAVSDAVNCILQAARGLECAHGLGIIHRDIKPSNLLRDANGVVKVADLGLARLSGQGDDSEMNSSITQAGSVLGTIDYMAPEQALDSTTVDGRVDIYSLGCTLYFLLAGRPPFLAGSIMALLLKHREAEIPSLASARPDVPAELDAIYRKMVAKKPAERFASMSDLISTLNGLVQSSALGKVRPSAKSQVASENTSTDRTIDIVPDKSGDTNVAAATLAAPVVAASATTVDQSFLHDWVAVLIEPSRTQAGIIRRYLEQLGIRDVFVAKAGREALELARRQKANVIVSSMHLADMTGVELATALLADSMCQKTGFVLATSEADTHESMSIPNDPRVALMRKPFDLDRLKISIISVGGQ